MCSMASNNAGIAGAARSTFGKRRSARTITVYLGDFGVWRASTWSRAGTRRPKRISGRPL